MGGPGDKWGVPPVALLLPKVLILIHAGDWVASNINIYRLFHKK